MVIVRVAPSGDEQPAIKWLDLKYWHFICSVILISLAAFEQRICVQGTAVQPRDMAGVDATLQGLKIVTFLNAFRDKDMVVWNICPFEIGGLRLALRGAKIGSNHATLFNTRIGFQFHPGHGFWIITL